MKLKSAQYQNPFRVLLRTLYDFSDSPRFSQDMEKARRVYADSAQGEKSNPLYESDFLDWFVFEWVLETEKKPLFTLFSEEFAGEYPSEELRALGETVLNFFEVMAYNEKGLHLRDLMGGHKGRTYWIHEVPIAVALSTHDIICGRIIPWKEGYHVCSELRCFPAGLGKIFRSDLRPFLSQRLRPEWAQRVREERARFSSRKGGKYSGGAPATEMDAARQALDEGDLEGALERYSREVYRNPGNSEALKQIGFIHYWQEEYDRGIHAFEKALDAGGSDPDLLVSLCAAQIAGGKTREAEAVLEQAIRRDRHHPRIVPLIADLGISYLMSGKRKEALHFFDRATKRAPLHRDLHYTIATNLAQGGLHRDAVFFFTEALSIDSTFAEGCYSLAETYRSMEEYKKALSFYQQAVEYGMQDEAMVWMRIGACHFREEDFHKARAAWMQSREAVLWRAKAENNLGVIEVLEHRLDDGEAHFRRSLRWDPYLGAAWLNLGLVRLSLADPGEAREAFREVLRLKPAHPKRAFLLELSERRTLSRIRAEWLQIES